MTFTEKNTVKYKQHIKRNKIVSINLLLIAFILIPCILRAETTLDTPTFIAQFKITEATIDSIHGAIKRGQSSCLNIIQAYLDRIKAYDQRTTLNVIVSINPNAITIAKEKDHILNSANVGQHAGHQKLKPLHCVPVIVKDNVETISMPTSAGSIAFKDYMSGRDAVLVRRLKAAGAIILAKSNMGEWAFSPYETISSLAGETKNAYDLKRVPAGSSGGTASAVAANFGLVGIGTDTGNSVRGPASHLALVGLRPTQDLFDQTGIVPLLKNRDMAGPMTRTVMDAAILLDAMVAQERKKQSGYSAGLSVDSLKNIRIGVMRSISNTPTLDLDIEALFEQAIKDLQNFGAVIVDPFKINEFKILTKNVTFCSRFRYDVNNYFASLNNTPPIKLLKEIVQSKQFHKKSGGGMKWAMSISVTPEKQKIPCLDVEGDPRRKALKDSVIQAMDKHNVDVIIYPSWNNPARELGDTESPHGNNSPIIAPHTGQPAITVPMGFTSNGLPAGLQILGRAYSEHDLLNYAYAYEQYTRHRKPSPLFPVLKVKTQ